MKHPLMTFARAVAICCVSIEFAACSHQTHSTSSHNSIVESGPKVNPEQGKTLLEDNAKVLRET